MYYLVNQMSYFIVEVAGLQETSCAQIQSSGWVSARVIDGCFLIADTSLWAKLLHTEAPEGGWLLGGGSITICWAVRHPVPNHSSLSLLTQATGK